MFGYILATLPNLIWLAWALLAFVILFGLVALFSPRWFARFAEHGGKWVDSTKVLRVFDKRFDIDKQVMRYSRSFGVVVLVACGILAYVLYSFAQAGNFGF